MTFALTRHFLRIRVGETDVWILYTVRVYSRISFPYERFSFYLEYGEHVLQTAKVVSVIVVLLYVARLSYWKT